MTGGRGTAGAVALAAPRGVKRHPSFRRRVRRTGGVAIVTIVQLLVRVDRV